ncbi:hypothetical protein [Yoonia sp. R2-816]|uniref:hypothetical protein n=1 Tax=Yoonia sp. R2-816 TaxID=3342638 RepID=UPI00372718BE
MIAKRRTYLGCVAASLIGISVIAVIHPSNVNSDAADVADKLTEILTGSSVVPTVERVARVENCSIIVDEFFQDFCDGSSLDAPERRWKETRIDLESVDAIRQNDQFDDYTLLDFVTLRGGETSGVLERRFYCDGRVTNVLSETGIGFLVGGDNHQDLSSLNLNELLDSCSNTNF